MYNCVYKCFTKPLALLLRENRNHLEMPGLYTDIVAMRTKRRLVQLLISRDCLGGQRQKKVQRGQKKPRFSHDAKATPEPPEITSSDNARPCYSDNQNIPKTIEIERNGLRHPVGTRRCPECNAVKIRVGTNYMDLSVLFRVVHQKSEVRRACCRRPSCDQFD